MTSTHVCSNVHCEHIGWSVHQNPHHPKIWQIRNHTHSFLVAAHQPICPICGEGLLKLAPLTVLPETVVQEDPTTTWEAVLVSATC